MKRRTFCIALMVPMLVSALLVLVPGPAEAGWSCSMTWSAYTTERAMTGTFIECACGIPFHTCGESWVDIVGGVSQTCDNHSRTFKGWTGGSCETGGGLCEWDMCDPGVPQESNSLEWIESVDQGWDRFPSVWGCPPPSTTYMNDPFFSVYDLDGCSIKQLAGSIYYSDFALQRTLVSGDCSNPGSVVHYRYSGGDGVRCCGGDPVVRNSVDWHWDAQCSASGGYQCRAASWPPDCSCDCSFGCDTCEAGQPCECPSFCSCFCDEWECLPGITDPFGRGRCEQRKTAVKYPSCEGGDTNGKLCSDFHVVGDYICVWI